MPFYWIGILIALLSGSSNNFGIVLEKKALNKLPEGKKVGRHLLKNPLWLTGFIFNIVITTFLGFTAQLLIGPTLVPGLEATGMIILAIGSLKILKEDIKIQEVMGILLMIIAIFFISFSKLSIDLNTYNLATLGFLTRSIIFTVIFIIGSFILKFLRRKYTHYKSILYALDSGLMFCLINFWIAPLLGTIDNIFSGSFLFTELILFILAIGILMIANYFGIFLLQKALEIGQASNMRPIQQSPIQIVPIFYFLLIFLLPPPSIVSLPLIISGISLILISMYLLSRRAASLEAIK
ncbi:MAG TPA: hypothetical protein VMV49_10060 [Candidatus Deferrimicrobium sp.]|nr:hypothetical protein [Candidatus Deferrimicrobium sp.]